MSESLTACSPKGFAAAVFAGGLSAGLYAAGEMGGQTLLAMLTQVSALYLSPLPLFAAGLGAGSVAGFLAAAMGTFALFLTMGAGEVLSYAIMNALPSAALCALALRHKIGANQEIYWYPEGRIVTAAILYPCVLFGVALVSFAGHDGGLLGATIDFFHASGEPIKAQLGDMPDAAEKMTAMLDMLAHYLPSLLGVSWFCVIALCLILAHVMLKRQGAAIRPLFAWLNLEIPSSILMLTAATGLLAAFAPEPYRYIGLNLAIMLGVPYFIEGLAVMHVWANRTASPKSYLTAFYLLISVVIFLLPLVALLGVAEQGLHFRGRLASGSKQP